MYPLLLQNAFQFSNFQMIFCIKIKCTTSPTQCLLVGMNLVLWRLLVGPTKVEVHNFECCKYPIFEFCHSNDTCQSWKRDKFVGMYIAKPKHFFDGGWVIGLQRNLCNNLRKTWQWECIVFVVTLWHYHNWQMHWDSID
jgi:hypothetical protein